MRKVHNTESDKSENKAGKSASLTLSRKGRGSGERKQAWGSKRAMLLSVVGACLSVTLLSASALAETCTASPDCKSLGYTESSCSDGGVKCPFGNYWFCATKCEEQPPCVSCYVGWILNSDMTCSGEKVSGKTPIGVVANQTITTEGASVKCVGMAVALKDIGSMSWSTGNSQCNSYSASGVTGWHLPTKEELSAIYGNISSVQGGLTKAGGTQFQDNYYWSSSFYDPYGSYNYHWNVNPISGNSDVYWEDYGAYVRPVLAF